MPTDHDERTPLPDRETGRRKTEVAITALFLPAATPPVVTWFGGTIPGALETALQVCGLLFGLLLLTYLSDGGIKEITRRGRGIPGTLAPVTGAISIAFFATLTLANLSDAFAGEKPLPTPIPLFRDIAAVGFLTLFPIYLTLRATGGKH